MKYSLVLASPFPDLSLHPVTPDTWETSYTKLLFHTLLFLEVDRGLVCLFVC